ncbi:amidohydrolase family protein [Ottowia sp.]|jgi:predicted TIM-barrel fold metal-dependent hydrolase|uniref:amidohydrolase family protein n=1 Tax=Ottowia sp. TaxID=1898956 RepID=UPI0025FF8A84|nr:amidohydrolase family protein [Ottowia sp.]MBK6615124.1 amidohydrolase family protein [Ottowia sp.]MBK6746202.1 amidohydrolase family protein [Ottowia sp.]
MAHTLSKPALSRAVDTHFHVFDAGVAVAGARYVPGYDAPLAQWREAAGAAGIGRGVLVQTSFLGTDNARLLRELDAHPDLLRGVAVVAPGAGAALLQDLHRHGVRGIRLNLAGRPTGIPEWAAASGLWDTLGALGWHVELHTDVGALPPVMAQLPAHLPLVIDHMGKPDQARLHDPTVAAVARRAATRPVWIKLSGPYRLQGRDPAALARLWQGELGDGALLWGSDWPFTNHEHEARYGALHRALFDWVDEPAATRILTGNPDALYWAA